MKQAYQTKLTVEGSKARSTAGVFDIYRPEPIGPAVGQHPAFAGSLSDSNWAREELNGFYDDIEGELVKLTAAAKATRDPKFDDYRSDIKEQRRMELVIPHVEDIEARIAKEAKEKQAAVDFARSVKRDAGEIAEPKNEIEGLRQDMRAREIRDAVRGMAPKEREAILQRAVADGDLFVINALADSMAQLFAIHPHIVERAREEVVDAKFPWVKTLNDYHEHVYQALSVRSVEVMSEVKLVLSKAGLDYDKVQRHRHNLAKQKKAA